MGKFAETIVDRCKVKVKTTMDNSAVVGDFTPEGVPTYPHMHISLLLALIAGLSFAFACLEVCRKEDCSSGAAADQADVEAGVRRTV